MVARNRAFPLISDEEGRIIEIGRSGVFSGPVQGPPDIHAVSTAQKYPINSRLSVGERVFRYAEFGGTTAGGDLCASEAPAAAHDDLNPSGALVAIGSLSFTLIGPGSGSDDIIKDEYEEGYAVTEADTGAGYAYAIKTNAALDISDTAARALVVLWDPLSLAINATTDMKLLKNRFKEIVIIPTTIAAPPCGVSMGVGADGSFGWVQTRGPAPVLTSGTVVIGQHVRAAGATTAGAVMALDRDVAAEDEAEVGYVMDVGPTTEYSLIYVTLE